jgi:hypothetical protein
LELPATSLIEPFLADIDASPRALLETMFSISIYRRNRRVSTSEVISGGGAAGNPLYRVFLRKISIPATILLIAAVPERSDAEGTRSG